MQVHLQIAKKIINFRELFEIKIYIGFNGHLLVLFSFSDNMLQTTKFLTAGGQYNQDKIVNFDK